MKNIFNFTVTSNKPTDKHNSAHNLSCEAANLSKK